MFRMALRTAGLVVFMALLAAPSGARAAVIKIGVAGPMTGDQAAFGEMLKSGALLAVAALVLRGECRRPNTESERQNEQDSL